MRILVTGAGGNVGKGIIPRLRTAGHDVVLSDLNQLNGAEFDGLPFHQIDVQHGFGLEKAAEGCDLILHTPAWHGVHWNQKTEADFWRLNVDGTFWAYQAARTNAIRRFVFLSSQSWHGHYDKYGFTKRVGEELCEYHRQANGIAYVSIRPHDFTPWDGDWINRYGARLLYGGVDREDVLDCVALSVEFLGRAHDSPGVIVDATRPNVFTEAQVGGWESNPEETCEALFPGSRALVERYGINVRRKPGIVSSLGWDEIGYRPSRHFGTFLSELRKLDEMSGPDHVSRMVCPY